MPALSTLQDLLISELKDLYSAEKQLLRAIPKMKKGSTMPELAAAFASHLEETRNQVARLEEIGQVLGTKMAGKKCAGMEGIIAEGAEVLEEDGDATILDIAITAAACRVEHYEMAGYQTAIVLAEQLGHGDVVDLLTESLHEEQAADNKMNELGQNLMDTVNEPAEEEEVTVTNPKPRTRRAGR